MTIVAKLLSFRARAGRGSLVFIEFSSDDELSTDEIEASRRRAKALYREFGKVTVTEYDSDQRRGGQALLIMTSPTGLNFRRLSRLVDLLLPGLECTKLLISNTRDVRVAVAWRLLREIQSSAN